MNQKKLLIYMTILLLFLVYLVKADYIFNVLINTEYQSDRIKMDLPAESDAIMFEIEEAGETTHGWKKILYIRGWMATDPELETDKVYIVLNNNSDLVFRANKENVIPRVLHHHIEMPENNIIRGFEFNIPMYWLRDGSYQVGIILQTEDNLVYSILKNKFLEKVNDAVQLNNTGI